MRTSEGVSLFSKLGKKQKENELKQGVKRIYTERRHLIKVAITCSVVLLRKKIIHDDKAQTPTKLEFRMKSRGLVGVSSARGLALVMSTWQTPRCRLHGGSLVQGPQLFYERRNPRPAITRACSPH